MRTSHNVTLRNARQVISITCRNTNLITELFTVLPRGAPHGINIIHVHAKKGPRVCNERVDPVELVDIAEILLLLKIGNEPVDLRQDDDPSDRGICGVI